MPSCSGNQKQVMTGGGIRSMLRRAGAGLRLPKLTKRNKPQKTSNEQYEMVSMGPMIATTRFGSKSKYNNRAVHRQAVEDLETYVVDLKQHVAELEKAKAKCDDEFAYRGVELNKVNGERNQITQIHAKLEKEHNKTVKELESAVAKLAECEASKASGSRRRKAAAKMYRQAHVGRTLAELNTEEALDKAIEAEEAFVKAENAYKDLKAKYDTAVAHSGIKSEKVTELGTKLNAAAETVKQLEKALKKAQKSAELNKGKYETMNHAATILDRKAARLESNLVDAREAMALAEKKSERRKFAQNIAHGALSMEQRRAAKARKDADAAIGKLEQVVNAAKSDQRRLASTERKLASAERRTQRKLPVPELNIARGASRMTLKRTMRQTNAIAANHNAFMAQQQQNHAIMNAYQAGRRANAASAKKIANKAKALEANNALTRAMEKRGTPQKKGGSSKTNKPVVGLRFTSSG